MGTVPTFDTWTAGENPTAAKMTSNIKTAGDFFRSVPACLLRQTSAQTLTSGTETTITMDTTDIDTDSMADLTNETIIIKTAGIYHFGAGIVFAANATGYRRIVIIDNAAANIVGQAGMASGGVQHYMSASRIRRFAVNDTIKLSAQQASGAGLATVVTGGEPCLWAYWMGA